VPILMKIDQEMRRWECPQTDTQTDTLTDANRFHNYLLHAICYSYGTDNYNFSRVCLSVCKSACTYVRQTITFESLDVGSSYLHTRCISMEDKSSSYIKVIGSRSRSQKQKRSQMPVHVLINFCRSAILIGTRQMAPQTTPRVVGWARL